MKKKYVKYSLIVIMTIIGKKLMANELSSILLPQEPELYGLCNTCMWVIAGLIFIYVGFNILLDLYFGDED